MVFLGPLRAFCAALLLVGCSSGVLRDAEVLAVGDSVIWWNSLSDRSVADGLADMLDLRVANAAVPGARVLAGRSAIPRQYQPGAWDWVVVNGGANDLGSVCGTAAAGDRLDQLIGSAASAGAIPALVARIRADGARVVVTGYYKGPVGGGPFSGCEGDLAVLNDRLALLARQTDGVFFAPADQVIVPANLDHYDRDRVHPSPLGSRLIAQQIAALIRSAGPE